MEDYKIILKMIEEVSKDDTRTLDKINILTLRFITGADVHIIETDYDGSVYGVNASGEEVDLHRCYYKNEINFTHSRDALKAIRPDSWSVNVYINDSNGNAGCCMRYRYGTKVPAIFSSKIKEEFITDLPTEELAELHATIQAIAYERAINETI